MTPDLPETAESGTATGVADTPRAGKRRPIRLPRSLKRDEREQLLAQPSRRYPTGVRNRSLMGVMLRAGLRCAEALELRSRDIDFAGDKIRVHGKGNKERMVPIDPTLKEMLLEWRARRPSGDRFFNTLQGAELGDRYVRKMVKRYGAKAGLVDVHPHLLRHTCATAWVGERRLPLHEVQLLMGHASIRTTQRYLHATLPDLVDTFRAFTD